MPEVGNHDLPPGALVVLHPGAAVVAVESPEDPAVGEAAHSGVVAAQLLEKHERLGWLICCIDGRYVYAPEDSFRLITADELEDLGMEIVLGPASKLPELARQMTALLYERGYATMHTMLSAAQRKEILDTVCGLDEEGFLQRLPAKFEAGYLGKGGKAKVALLEAVLEGAPEFLGAALPGQDETLAALSEMISPALHEQLGFTIYSKTNLMMRLPFSDSDDEALYPAPEANPKEVDGFLALMGRKRLCTLHCIGPGACTVRLLPKTPDFPEIVLCMQPNTMLAFVCDFYDYESELEGLSVLLQCFFLEQPLEFTLQPQGSLELSPEDLPLATGPGLPAGEPICVVGMASKDPCHIDDHEKLWTALRHGGCDGFVEIPYTRFDIDEYILYEDQNLAVQNNKSYCRHQGQCEGIEIFDSAFFNVPQQEAFGMDPEQRYVMETGWMAMAEAGYDRKKVQKDSAHLGIFVGISSSDWNFVNVVPSQSGVPETFIANRFSYIVNLKGPSFISNTACSASLVAMHTAKVHLMFPTDPLDGAIVAGVSMNTGPGTWVANCAGNMLSFLGRSFSFNGSADGYGRGEGCAAAVIKPCEFDPTDPHVYALVAGTHTNSDGRSASLTAPNGPAQQRLLRAILSETQLEAPEICVYEAHGTGTSLGDPIEVGAVRKVLTQRHHPLMTSCSKTNLGHLEGGAGMSSFCKCVMACMHTECAPNQHFNLLNPHLDIDGWPMFMLAEAQPTVGNTAYVGVSGFGYGGTNAHAMAYGRNVVTSRGESNPKYLEKSLFAKVTRAAEPQVSMEGENYEDWVSAGVPHLRRDHGVNYSVQLLEDGSVMWREVAHTDLSEATSFQIQGSFSGWELLGLEPSDEEPGLWGYELTLGSSGEALFQIAVEHDPYHVLYPEQPRCSRQAARILGPAAAPSKDHAWLVSGDAGARYRVEFFQSGTTAAVRWSKCQEESPQLMDRDEIQE